jgi:hypothetical protein
MTFGSARMDNAFDRWRTGNFGEDQFDGENELFEFAEKTCVECLCRCPIFERYMDGEDCFDDFMDRCLIIKSIIEQNYERDREFERQMEKAYWAEPYWAEQV